MKPQSPSPVGRHQGRGKERDEVREGGGLKTGAGVRSLERLEVSSTSPCWERGRDDDHVAMWEVEEARWGHCLPNLLLRFAWRGCSYAVSLKVTETNGQSLGRALPPPAR